jgi:hypothetical protein
MSTKHTPGTKLSRPLMQLLMEAPERAVFLVQDAIRAVAADDWQTASALMNFAAEAEDTDTEWFKVAGRCADELHAVAESKATGSRA